MCAIAAVLSSLFIWTRADTPAAAARTASSVPEVRLQTVPDDGIQPQAVVDDRGTIHLLFFNGDPSGGDLYYVRIANGTPGRPVRVNSVPGSALATGSVRGGQLALGRGGRVHVAWHGSKAPADRGSAEAPMWYARSTADGSAFEPQRVVSGPAAGLDGGTIAADRAGHVIVAWHAMGAAPGEDHRTVYLARSSDDGQSFAAESPATSAPIGACGCCGMRAIFDRSGALHLLYRAATDGKHRDTTWLTIDRGGARAPVRVHPWDLEACPMSTFALVETPGGLAAAWETAQQIYAATLNTSSGTVSAVEAVPGNASRKHPSIAVNRAGDRLIAWTEGTAWKRGGTMAWRLTDRNGTELASAVNAAPVPVWGLVAAVALPDGSFRIYR